MGETLETEKMTGLGIRLEGTTTEIEPEIRTGIEIKGEKKKAVDIRKAGGIIMKLMNENEDTIETVRGRSTKEDTEKMNTR